VEDLQRFLEDRPVMARRLSRSERARRWLKRHPGPIGAGVLLLALACIGLLIHNRSMSVEQARTAAALDREMQRATEAEHRFQQARQAVDVLIETSEEDLAEDPRFFATRKRLLETAVQYYQEFIEQQSGNPATQQELALVQSRVKGILRELASLHVFLQSMLLENASVQSDLELTAQQKQKVEEFVAHVHEARPAFSKQFRALSREARRRQILDQAELQESSLDQLFTSVQRKRLRQIVLQVLGLAAFQEPEIIRVLKLTRDQRREIREIEFETFAPFDRGQPPLGPSLWHDSNDPRHQLALRRAVDLLDAQQAMTWKEIAGPPFEGSASFRPPGPFDRPDDVGSEMHAR